MMTDILNENKLYAKITCFQDYIYLLHLNSIFCCRREKEDWILLKQIPIDCFGYGMPDFISANEKSVFLVWKSGQEAMFALVFCFDERIWRRIAFYNDDGSKISGVSGFKILEDEKNLYLIPLEADSIVVFNKENYSYSVHDKWKKQLLDFLKKNNKCLVRLRVKHDGVFGRIIELTAETDSGFVFFGIDTEKITIVAPSIIPLSGRLFGIVKDDDFWWLLKIEYETRKLIKWNRKNKEIVNLYDIPSEGRLYPVVRKQDWMLMHIGNKISLLNIKTGIKRDVRYDYSDVIKTGCFYMNGELILIKQDSLKLFNPIVEKQMEIKLKKNMAFSSYINCIKNNSYFHVLEDHETIFLNNPERITPLVRLQETDS